MTVNTSDDGQLVDYVFITITVSIPLMVDYYTISWLRFYYYDCVNTSDGGLLVDYVLITMTVSIPLMVDY